MSEIEFENCPCPVERSLKVIGDKWSALILRDFFLKGARRYQDLQNSLKGISPNLLSKRLSQFVDFGLLEKERYSETPIRYRYKMTTKGKSLQKIIKSLRDWGEAHTSNNKK